MDDTGKTGKGELPGNHGQFGADIETENYEALPDLEVPDPGPAGSGAGGTVGPGAAPAAADEGGVSTPGQKQEQGGMRS